MNALFELAQNPPYNGLHSTVLAEISLDTHPLSSTDDPRTGVQRRNQYLDLIVR